MEFKNHRQVVRNEKDLETGEAIIVPYIRLVRGEQSGYLNIKTYLDRLAQYQQNRGPKEFSPFDKIQSIGVGGKIRFVAGVRALPSHYFPKTCEHFGDLEERTVN